MDCANCGRANRVGAKFCGGCGRPLAPRCPACGSESQPDSQFCDACGAPLVASPAGAAEARKVVTIVFADLIGSTALHERLDAESARRFMERYYRTMRAAVEAHGGTVTQLLGDGVKAVFGAPRVAEDDAIRAVRAAVAMQRAFRELADEQLAAVGPIGLRVAVNTGEVVANDATEIIGDPVNVAARLQEEARDGGVVIGEATRRLVAELVTLAPLGSFALKGRSEAVAAYRVVSLDRPAGAAAIAFVGREDELRRITAVYDTAIAAPAARLAVLLGSPGLGKSRLIDEFTRRLGDGASVLLAHCDAAGGATFAPLAEALRGLLRIDAGSSGDALRSEIESALPGDEPERTRIASGVAALISGTPASPEEIFFVVRRLLTAFAAVRPVVLAIDDIQWAEPLLLDLIEHLVQWGSGVRLLVLAAARPELRDTRSSLATPGGLVADVVTLAGLDAGAATRLAANVIGAADLPAAVAAKVLATSEGNPLFVAELVRMLVHDGALKREGDRWTTGAQLAGIEMPPTIQALLAARIERLRPEERTVLERAAVVGRQFSRPAVAQLLPREISDLDARLESLRRSELIEPDTGWFLGEPVLRFHHVLIRDAAYRRLLKNTRAELHGRFADWLETRAAGAVEHDETLGWHLEQAHQHLCELGPIDAQGRAVGERAASHLAAAGRRALARDDVPLAAGLLGRALARLDAGDPERADLALDWCEALLSAGDVGAAAKAIDELGRFIDDSDRLRAWHICFAGQLAALTNPQALRATADAVAVAAESLTAAGDAAGEAKAHSVHALALARLGKVGACEAALDRALAAARRAHDRRRANGVLAGAPLAALWGPSPVTRASGRCLDVVRVLRITQGAPAVEAVALSCQGVLEALRGRTDAARRMIASSRHMVEELGITHRLLDVNVFAGRIELLEGNAVAAERCLRSAYDGLRDLGLGIDAARAAALLARALLALDRAADAEALSYESEALAGDDLQAAIAWRGVRAEALARRGEHAAAVEFARAAVEIAAATDALLDHADARLALAAALRAAGRSAEADAEEARAIELWEAKGATLLAERARSSDGRTAEVDRTFVARAESARGSHRRVRANAATAHAAHEDAAFAARDADALTTLFADELEVVDHSNGATLDQLEYLTGLRRILRVQNLTRRHEPLASLGDALALCRMSLSAGGVARGSFDVGAYEVERVVLFEVDAQGRCGRAETFASDHLDDAVAHMYERYAELLSDGPARTRAAATARSVAANMGPHDVARYATAIGPAIEFADHRTMGFESVRGADGMLRVLRSINEVAHDVANRVDDVLELRSDAYLLRWTNFGTDRAGGGAFERHLLLLWVFGTDGLVTRWELFDADREAEALARFDELAAEPASARLAAAASRAAEKRERRVRANAATANAARFDAAVAAQDAEAFLTLLADRVEAVDHTTGLEYDRERAIRIWRALRHARDTASRTEPFATLGDSLALCGTSISASASALGDLDVGAVAWEQLVLIEVDAQERRRRDEVFSRNHMGDAVARLYERYAELLPDGSERARAVATARSVTTLLGPFEPDRWATVWAPAIEFCDSRTVGMGPVHGADALLPGVRALFELTADWTTRVDDILDLRSDALLLRWTNFGTDRASGGAFERNLCQLWTFGTDGLLTRWEQSEADRDAEALARFDELTAARAARRVATAPSPAAEKRERRVRANAAMANAARVSAAIAARDVETFGTLLTDDLELVHHPTGTTYDRQGALATVRSLLSARDPTHGHEPLASLGDSLALCRISTSASGFAGRTFDVGAYESEEILLIEVDAQERRRRGEYFAADHLGDAVARLYERYAALLPDGPERARAAAKARSAAAYLGAWDPDDYATAFAPSIEVVDHRILGTWSSRGADELLRNIRSWHLLTDNTAIRQDDILSLQPDALLGRRTFFGTDRAGGGAFERQFLQLWIFGSDGLLTRLEYFDADRDAEALARFDELTAAPRKSPRFENAATRWQDQFEAARKIRDLEHLATLYAAGYQQLDRRTLVHLELDRGQALESIRHFFEYDSIRYSWELLATRGDRLALGRGFTEMSDDSSGPSEIEWLTIVEVDEAGRRVAGVLFDPGDLDAAYAELDERYAAGEAAPHAGTWEMLQRFMRTVASRDWERVASVYTEDFVFEDHRLLGWGTRSWDETLKQLLAMVELAPDARLRSDHALAINRRGILNVARWMGSRDGGVFEIPLVGVILCAPDGRFRRIHSYALDQLDAARACFDALTSEPPALRIENAATRAADRFGAVWEARDWKRSAELFPTGFRQIDRRAMVQLELDRDQFLEWMRTTFEMSSSRLEQQVLATRGDRLALSRDRVEVADHNLGPSEIESLSVIEVGEHGERVATVRFDPDDLDAAYAELEERYAAGEGARGGQWAVGDGSYSRAIAARDWDALAALCAPELVVNDHRLLGWEPLRGRTAYIESVKALFDLAPDARLRIDHIIRSDHGELVVSGWVGTRDGGAFEMPRLVVIEYDRLRRMSRIDGYDPEQLDAARARFAALRPDPLRIPPNAATRASDRFAEALVARDWDALRTHAGDEFRYEDRTRWALVSGDVEVWIASVTFLVTESGARAEHELLGTVGDRIALHQTAWRGASDGTRFELDRLRIFEVDADGKLRALILFDPDDRHAAFAEAQARFAAGEAAAIGGQAPIAALIRAIGRHDWEALREALARDAAICDRRALAIMGEVDSEQWIDSLRTLADLAPDVDWELIRVLAWNRHGRVGAGRLFGTTRDGGPFENAFVAVLLTRGDQIQRYEFFDVADADRALARFEELCAP